MRIFVTEAKRDLVSLDMLFLSTLGLKRNLPVILFCQHHSTTTRSHYLLCAP